jgi:hypothetical protein
MTVREGDCVKLPDGRIARVRERVESGYKVRVRRTTSNTHQFLELPAEQLEQVECPSGWMSPDGYTRYLKTTLAKMRQRHGAPTSSKTSESSRTSVAG